MKRQTSQELDSSHPQKKFKARQRLNLQELLDSLEDLSLQDLNVLQKGLNERYSVLCSQLVASIPFDVWSHIFTFCNRKAVSTLTVSFS
jgi:hypothetical protein